MLTWRLGGKIIAFFNLVKYLLQEFGDSKALVHHHEVHDLTIQMLKDHTKRTITEKELK